MSKKRERESFRVTRKYVQERKRGRYQRPVQEDKDYSTDTEQVDDSIIIRGRIKMLNSKGEIAMHR